MRLTEGQAGARVLAFGGYQPARVVTNDELSKTVDTNDEWIRSRVGIASRRIAAPDETVADMATAAGGKALAGMAKRALPGVELLAIKAPDQLDAARALVAAHSTAKHGAAGHNGLEPKEA